MPSYLIQVDYEPEGWAALIKHPQDRVAAVTPAIEALGGKVVAGYLCFGEYDIVAIVDMPDNVSAAAFSIAAGAGGSLRSIQTTPLMTAQEGIEAMRKAGDSSYRPAS